MPDKLVITASDEEWTFKVEVVVSPTARFFLRLLEGDDTDDKANEDDGGCSTTDDLLLGDARMFVDESISALEADESTSAIEPDWTTEEFCDCLTLLTEELTILWTTLALSVGKIDPSGDCVFTGLLLLEMTNETELIALVKLTLCEGSDPATVVANTVD